MKADETFEELNFDPEQDDLKDQEQQSDENTYQAEDADQDDVPTGFDFYMAQAMHYPLLNAEEIEAVQHSIPATRSTAMRQRMIESHLRMVPVIAKDYIHPRFRFDDLVQVGNIGLIKAADEFDPINSKIPLIFYKYAEGKINDAIRVDLNLVHQRLTDPARTDFLNEPWHRGH